MLRLGYARGLVQRLPTFRLLKEDAPRSGFFEDVELLAVRAHLPADLQVALDLAHRLGWRIRETVLNLERRHVDLEAGTITLDLSADTTKSEATTVYLTPALVAGLRAQVARVEALSKALGAIVPWLFPLPTGARRVDFRRAWATACRKAGVDRLKHDLRRTATRNLVRAGVPERVAMTITGHRTRSVFDRYHIVAPADLQAAAEKLAALDGHNPGHNPVASMADRRISMRKSRTRL
jgi:integrase